MPHVTLGCALLTQARTPVESYGMSQKDGDYSTVFYHVLSCSFMRLICSVTFWHVLCESYSISHVLLLDLLPGINTARCSPSCTVVSISSTLLPECV